MNYESPVGAAILRSHEGSHRGGPKVPRTLALPPSAVTSGSAPTAHATSSPLQLQQALPPPHAASPASRLIPSRRSALSRAFLDRPVRNPSSTPSHSNPGAGNHSLRAKPVCRLFPRVHFYWDTAPSCLPIICGCFASTAAGLRTCTADHRAAQPRCPRGDPSQKKGAKPGSPIALPASSPYPESDFLPAPARTKLRRRGTVSFCHTKHPNQWVLNAFLRRDQLRSRGAERHVCYQTEL